MMTGLLPRSHGDRVYSDRMPMPNTKTLAHAFRDNGYQKLMLWANYMFIHRETESDLMM